MANRLALSGDQKNLRQHLDQQVVRQARSVAPDPVRPPIVRQSEDLHQQETPGVGENGERMITSLIHTVTTCSTIFRMAMTTATQTTTVMPIPMLRLVPLIEGERRVPDENAVLQAWKKSAQGCCCRGLA